MSALSKSAKSLRIFWRDTRLQLATSRLIDYSCGLVPARKMPKMIAAWRVAQQSALAEDPSKAMENVCQLAADPYLSTPLFAIVADRYSELLRAQALRDLDGALKGQAPFKLTPARAVVLSEFLGDIFPAKFDQALQIMVDVLAAPGASDQIKSAALKAYTAELQGLARFNLLDALQKPVRTALFEARAFALKEHLPKIFALDFESGLFMVCALLASAELNQGKKQSLASATFARLPKRLNFPTRRGAPSEKEGALIILPFLENLLIHAHLDQDLTHRAARYWRRAALAVAIDLESMQTIAGGISQFAEKLSDVGVGRYAEVQVIETWKEIVGQKMAKQNLSLALSYASWETEPRDGRYGLLYEAATAILENLRPKPPVAPAGPAAPGRS